MRVRTLGFTLVEMLVSVALVAVLVMYLSYTFTTQQRAYTVVDQVTEAQQNLRAIAALVDYEARRSGFMVPEAAAFCGIDDTDGPDTLFVTDADAIDPTNQTFNDLSVDVVSGFVPGAAASTLNLSNLVLDGAAVYDEDADGAADSDFRQNAGAILVDAANPERGAICGTVTNVDVPGTRIDVAFAIEARKQLAPLTATSAAERLVAVPANHYQVQSMQLQHNGRLLANEVEDLQFALFYDLDGNGLVTGPAEMPGSLGTQYLSDGFDNQLLREIRINIVVRTRAPDPEARQLGQFQITENRVMAGGGPPPADGFRRRVFTSTVRPRNVGLRVF